VEITSLTIQVQDGAALLMHGPLTEPAHVEAALAFALAFAPLAISTEFTDRGCNYRVSQTGLDYNFPAAQRQLWEAEDPSKWALRDGVLEGLESAVMLTGLLNLLEHSKATAIQPL
jgi:hypothetical protein